MNSWIINGIKFKKIIVHVININYKYVAGKVSTVEEQVIVHKSGRNITAADISMTIHTLRQVCSDVFGECCVSISETYVHFLSYVVLNP